MRRRGRDLAGWAEVNHGNRVAARRVLTISGRISYRMTAILSWRGGLVLIGMPIQGVTIYGVLGSCVHKMSTIITSGQTLASFAFTSSPISTRPTSTFGSSPKSNRRKSTVKFASGTSTEDPQSSRRPTGLALRRRATLVDQSNQTYNLLRVLTTAQSREIDFVGITWQAALGTIGKGGEGEISQADISIKDKFAFKRSVAIGTKAKDDSDIFQELNSEVQVLGHPKIRQHPNIVSLEGLCWEINVRPGGRDWLGRATPDKEKAWPVLILDKAPHGDLEKFMRTEKGRAIKLENRMQLCAQVASALKTMHMNNIIHGDVKPKNTLVFDSNDEIGVTVKVTDFGYSTMYSGDRDIKVPMSVPWDPPDFKRMKRIFKPPVAKGMDVYSFGVLCLWVLFHEKLEELGKETQQTNPNGYFNQILKSVTNAVTTAADKSGVKNAIGGAVQVVTSFATGAKQREPRFDLVHLGKLRDDETMQKEALKIVKGHPDLSPDQQQSLSRLFELALTNDVKDRTIDFDELIKLLGHDRFVFSIIDELQTLCQADYRVREELVNAVKEYYEDHPENSLEAKDAAFQLAFCYKLGLGTLQSDEEAAKWLDKSGPDAAQHLEEKIEATRTKKKFSSPKLRRMYEKGLVKPIDHALEFQTSKNILVQKEQCETEIKSMKKVLGNTHYAVLNLQSTLSSILRFMNSPEYAILLERWCEELKAEPTTGPGDNDLLVIRHDLGLVRMAQMRINEGEGLLKQSYEEAKVLLGEDHVFTMMSAMNLAQAHQSHGRAKTAHELASYASSKFSETLGPKDKYSLAIQALYYRRLMAEGEIEKARAVLKANVEDMEKAVGAKEPQFIERFMEYLMITADFGSPVQAEEAAKELLEKLPAAHPFRGHLSGPIMANLRYQQGKYEEVLPQLRQMRKFLKNFPWPPPQLPQQPNVPQPGQPPIDPLEFVCHPELCQVTTMQAIACQALASTETNPSTAAKLKDEAKKTLADLIKDMGKAFGGELWEGIGKEPALKGSAMGIVFAEGKVRNLELLAATGSWNVRGGIHYDAAIEVAQEKNLPKIAEILTEHRLLCGGVNHCTPFETRDQLREFISGKWEGHYLFRQPGFRLDKRAKIEIELSDVTDDPANPDVVLISGLGVDDLGRREYHGQVDLSGKVTYLHYMEGEGAGAAWEFTGYIHREKMAVGGSWGFRNRPATSNPLGVKFMFKLPDEPVAETAEPVPDTTGE
ncbi:hypothetical protein Dda_6804 [Drechslerella dactyloides]|uniref:Protein kinase domain-containing protein n=1 Tax=Drechslerella dactyloides TaxID=74499 RepID=A0AAD6IY47_DREDA|nr:hypothetical protein Dda_6804 [Drechslerella dactyloides]